MKSKGVILLILSGLIFFILLHVIQIVEKFGVYKIKNIENEIINAPLEFYITNEGFKVAIILTLIFIGFSAMYFLNNKKYLQGKEHGSAEWGTKKDAEKLSDYNSKNNNIILSNSEYLSLNTRQHHKNLNLVIVGSPGSGKTRNCIKPNLMETNTNYICTDPKGELLASTGKMMITRGYKIKVLNLLDMQCGNQYNPFDYIEDDTDVLRMIDVLIKNTTPEGRSGGDPFWEKAETALLQAICFYLVEHGGSPQKNFATVMEFLRYAVVKEDKEDYVSKLDAIMLDLEEENPENIAVKQYKIFKQASGKTAKTILVSVGVRLAVFNMSKVKDLTSKDTMNLAELGEEKTILYVIIPDSNSTFNFIATIMFTQLFATLYKNADNKPEKKLKIHVRLMLDEFANIGVIPDFDKILATCRSREISATIIVQGLSQLKKMYKDAWETIITGCSTVIYLGSQEQSTHEYISKALGKMTIHQRSTSLQKGRNRSSSINENLMGRELMTPDEVQRLDPERCIVLVQGMKPFYSLKFKIERHRNYRLLAESGENYFNPRNLKRVTKKEDPFEHIQFTPSDI